MPTKTATTTEQLDITEPGRSTEVERWLHDSGVPFTFLGYVDLAEFDLEAGLENQARLGAALKEDTVSRYVEALRGGAVFPGVVAYRNRAGKLVNVDGNHRTAAHRLLNKPVTVYEIEADRKIRTMLTFVANTRNGLPTSEEERLHQGLWLVDNGMSMRDAAHRLMLPYEKLAREKANAEANRRAVDSGVALRDWEALPRSARQRLGVISTDEGFAAATRLVRQANLTAEDINTLVADLNKSKSAETQVGVVHAYRDIHAERVQEGDFTPKRGKRQVSARGRYASAVGFTLVLPPADAIIERMTPPEIPDEIAKIDKAMGKLEEIRTALEKRASQS